MDSTLLCNVPNCSHTTSECILEVLKKEEQLPIIYNGAAYFFENNCKIVDNNGKNTLDLNFIIKKYDFQSCTFSDIAKVEGFNANLDSGCYLIGSDYYFTTNVGNPSYDETGNVVSYKKGGSGNLFCINLETGESKDYGEVFDYKQLEKKYPLVNNTLSIYLMGKIDSKLYIGINYMRDSNNLENPLWYGQNYTFDLDTKSTEKLDDLFSVCTMNGYHSYYDGNQNTTITLKDVITGETYNGPDILSWNAMTIFDNKVWHDDAKCFDIKTGEERKVSSYDYGQVIAEYGDSYIFMGTDDKEKTVFEKLPKSDFQ